MRKICERLMLFFVITQIERVANLIYKYQPAETPGYRILSYALSAGLALSVYVSFYFIQKKRWSVRIPAAFGVLLFGSIDLFFNVFDVVITVSQKSLIPPTSQFMWINGQQLQIGIQVGALIFGALPTLASGCLGWLQGAVTMLPDSEMGATTIWTRLGRSFAKIFDSFAIRFAIGFEAVGQKLSVVDRDASGNSAVVDSEFTGDVTPKRWPELNKDDVAYIMGNGRMAIMRKFVTSNGSAGNWKSWLAEGKRPWSDAKLPEKVA